MLPKPSEKHLKWDNSRDYTHLPGQPDLHSISLSLASRLCFTILSSLGQFQACVIPACATFSGKKDRRHIRDTQLLWLQHWDVFLFSLWTARSLKLTFLYRISNTFRCRRVFCYPFHKCTSTPHLTLRTKPLQSLSSFLAFFTVCLGLQKPVRVSKIFWVLWEKKRKRLLAVLLIQK